MSRKQCKRSVLGSVLFLICQWLPCHGSGTESVLAIAMLNCKNLFSSPFSLDVISISAISCFKCFSQALWLLHLSHLRSLGLNCVTMLAVVRLARGTGLFAFLSPSYIVFVHVAPCFIMFILNQPIGCFAD